MVVIAGIDLAWSGRKPTGVCIIEVAGGTSALLDLRCTPAHDAAEIHALLGSLGPHVVAGIDAPLVVSPQRKAESALARSMGARGVYAYSARADFLERHGIAEGPKLGAALAAAGWQLDPQALAPSALALHALEVFPHAAVVSLLGAPRALRYKKGRLGARLEPLSELQRLLRRYATTELPCLEAAPVLQAPIGRLPGAALKALEDQLDAIVCAISAHHAWRHGMAGLDVFGDAADGYIAVPKPVTSSPAPSSPSRSARGPERSSPQAPAEAVPATSPCRR